MSGCFYALGLLIYRTVLCYTTILRPASDKLGLGRAPHGCDGKEAQGAAHILYLLLAVEAALFGLFTMGMLCEQMSTLVSNRTYIDRLQDKRDGKKGPNGQISQSLWEVFGDVDSAADYLLPTKPHWEVWEDLFGYR
jgi:hypothetical protein